MSFIKVKDLDNIKTIYWKDSIQYDDLKEGRIVKIRENTKNVDYICINPNNCFFKPLGSDYLILVCIRNNRYSYRSIAYFKSNFPYSTLSNAEMLAISENTIDVLSIKTIRDLKNIYEKYKLNSWS